MQVLPPAQPVIQLPPLDPLLVALKASALVEMTTANGFALRQ